MNNRRLIRDFWFAYLSALMVWSCLSYKEIGNLLAQDKIFAFYAQGHPYVSDFVNVYNAAVISSLCTAGNVNIYDPVVQDESIKKIISPVKPELPFYIQYPPYFFVLVTPLAFMSLQMSWLVWSLIGVIGIFICWHMLVKTDYRGPFAKTILGVATLAAYPTWLTLKLGQTSVWLLLGLVFYWLLLRKHRFLSAGLATGLCLIKLQYMPIVWLSGIACSFALSKFKAVFKFLQGALLAAGVLFLISIVHLGWANVAAFPVALLNNESTNIQSGVQVFDMQNFRGELFLIAGGDSPLIRAIALIILAMVLLMVVYLWVGVYPKLQTRSTRSFELCASLTTLALLIVSPHTHIQDYLITVVPCCWLWICSDDPSLIVSRWQKIFMRGLIISFPVLSWLFYFFAGGLHTMYVQPYFLWALLLIALASMSMCKISIAVNDQNAD